MSTEDMISETGHQCGGIKAVCDISAQAVST